MWFKILQKVRLVLFDWQPNWIFYRSYSEYCSGDDSWSGSDFMGNKTSDWGFTSYTPIYTKLGKWFDDMPGIFSILKLPWYIITWPLYSILAFIWIAGFEGLLTTHETRRALADLYDEREKIWRKKYKPNHVRGDR